MSESWAHANPPKLLAIDLAAQDVRETGFWWCRGCHRISEPRDPGDPWPQCAHCSKRKLEWKEPSPERHRRQPVLVQPGEHAHQLFAEMHAAIETKPIS